MTPEETKAVIKATSKELANQRRTITKLEIENDELKQRIKELEKFSPPETTKEKR